MIHIHLLLIHLFHIHDSYIYFKSRITVIHQIHTSSIKSGVSVSILSPHPVLTDGSLLILHIHITNLFARLYRYVLRTPCITVQLFNVV